MQLTTNVYVDNTFVGANLGYVTTDEWIVMIDTPPRPTDAVKWRKEIESKGTLRYLIQTEPHDDHIIGAFFFAVPGIAHDITRKAIMEADQGASAFQPAELSPELPGLLLGRVRCYFGNPARKVTDNLTIGL